MTRYLLCFFMRKMFEDIGNTRLISLHLTLRNWHYLRAPCFCRILVDNSARMIAGSRTEGEYFPTQAREAHRPGVLPGGTVDGPCRGGCGRALGRGFSARPGGRRAPRSGPPTPPPRRGGPGAVALPRPPRRAGPAPAP